MNANLHRLIVIFALFCAAIFGFATAAQPICAEPICIKNTSLPVGTRRWDWTVFIDPKSQKMDEIRCVEYTLHRTYPNPVRIVCDKGEREQPFALSTNGWGMFKIKVRVLYMDSNLIELQHKLHFEPRNRSAPCPPTC